MKTALQEHRKVPRLDVRGRVEIELASLKAAAQSAPEPRLHMRLEANSVNLSEGGMCVRLAEPLEIRSQVRLRWFPEPSRRPLECAGRITWVVQRIDLRDAPPFLYDIGVEFINAPQRLRQFMTHVGLLLKSSAAPIAHRTLDPVLVNRRHYVPRLEREESTPSCWHLTVWVEGIPCFSRRYPSPHEATAGWEQFKRQLHQTLPRPAR